MYNSLGAFNITLCPTGKYEWICSSVVESLLNFLGRNLATQGLSGSSNFNQKWHLQQMSSQEQLFCVVLLNKLLCMQQLVIGRLLHLEQAVSPQQIYKKFLLANTVHMYVCMHAFTLH